LEATVARALNHGVLVDTSKGSGLVPLKELGLPPGADHRRAYPTGKTLRVVLLSRDGKDGKLRFSAVGVLGVEERRNYKEFSQNQPQASRGLANLGDLLRRKLGLPDEPEPEPAPEPEPHGEKSAEALSGGAASVEKTQPSTSDRVDAGVEASPAQHQPKPKDRSGELGVVRRLKRS
jgi:small subunit ribosomal protein S1